MLPVLLLVDIQNDYFPGGAMELPGATEAAAVAARLLAFFRERGLPVVHMQHIATRADATFLLPHTKGAALHPGVRPQDDEEVFEKHFPDSFHDTPLSDHLEALRPHPLVVAGMMTHMCVDSTVRSAADYGIPCALVSDACATRALSFGGRSVAAQDVQTAFLAALDGTFATVRTEQEIEAEINRLL